MNINVIKQRMKIKTHRNVNIAKSLIIVLFIVVFTVGNLICVNINKDNISEYINKTGDADLVALQNNNKDIADILKNAQEIEKLFIDDSQTVEINSNKHASILYGDLTNIDKKSKLILPKIHLKQMKY